jgi:magnesium-transporting ATPase (P-type)
MEIAYRLSLQQTTVGVVNPEIITQEPLIEGKLELMISGKSFSLLFSNEELRAVLNKVLSYSSVVILFRSSPKEKAEIVKFIRHYHP